MDCPHLNLHSIRVPSFLAPFHCSGCQTVESPWLCLYCGVINCGRYINGHAKQHAERKKHPLAVDCYALSTYCYECDDYITNQHRIPSTVFDRLNTVHDLTRSIGDNSNSSSSDSSSSSTTDISLLRSNGSTLASPPKTSRQRRRKDTVKPVRSRGRMNKPLKENPDPPSPPPAPPSVGSTASRGLPGGRKRSSGPSAMSGDEESRVRNSTGGDLSSSQNLLPSVNLKKQRLVEETSSARSVNGLQSIRNRAKENVSKGAKPLGLVGLRNLGNTCFMNSVVQSLSKIRGFSCYMVHIPPPHELLGTNNDANQTRRIYSTRSRRRSLLAASSSQNSINNGNGFTENGLELGRKEAMEIMRAEELLTNELRKILILLNTKGSSAVSPDSLFSIIWELMPRFRGYQQQDAHEFLRYVLDQIHSELIRLIPTFSWDGRTTRKSKGVDGACDMYLKDIGGKSLKNGGLSEQFVSVFGYHSIVTSMFGGILENEVRCSSCGTESRKNDPFLDLSLDIPVGLGGEARLEDCLSNFTGVEELSDDDKYFCSHCKDLQKSTKRFSIQRLPNVLCLHLKRFRWSNYLRTKLDHFVQFPMTSLDMSEYLLNKLQPRGSSKSKSNSSNMYDLAAVIVHHGTGVGSGHYTAFAKKDCQWYHFNDSTVKLIDELSVSKCKAYILFYTRSEFKI